jgi:hypothetical protein
VLIHAYGRTVVVVEGVRVTGANQREVCPVTIPLSVLVLLTPTRLLPPSIFSEHLPSVRSWFKLGATYLVPCLAQPHVPAACRCCGNHALPSHLLLRPIPHLLSARIIRTTAAVRKLQVEFCMACCGRCIHPLLIFRCHLCELGGVASRCGNSTYKVNMKTTSSTFANVAIVTIAVLGLSGPSDGKWLLEPKLHPLQLGKLATGFPSGISEAECGPVTSHCLFGTIYEDPGTRPFFIPSCDHGPTYTCCCQTRGYLLQSCGLILSLLLWLGGISYAVQPRALDSNKGMDTVLHRSLSFTISGTSLYPCRGINVQRESKGNVLR